MTDYTLNLDAAMDRLIAISGYDSNGYDILGYDADGYDSKGYNSNGFNRRGVHFDQASRYYRDPMDEIPYTDY